MPSSGLAAVRAHVIGYQPATVHSLVEHQLVAGIPDRVVSLSEDGDGRSCFLVGRLADDDLHAVGVPLNPGTCDGYVTCNGGRSILKLPFGFQAGASCHGRRGTRRRLWLTTFRITSASHKNG